MEVIIHVAIHSIYAFEIPLISQLKMGYLYTGFDFWHLLQLVQRVAKAIAEKTCNALLLKVHFDQAISNLEIIRCVWWIQWFTCDMQQVNQIGSVTESIEAVKMSKRAGWGVMTSHRRYPLVLFPSLSLFFVFCFNFSLVNNSPFSIVQWWNWGYLHCWPRSRSFHGMVLIYLTAFLTHCWTHCTCMNLIHGSN